VVITAEQVALIGLELEYSPVLSIEAACVLLGRISEDTLSRKVKDAGIKPWARGKYRKADILKLAESNVIDISKVVKKGSGDSGEETDAEGNRWPVYADGSREAGAEGQGTGVRGDGERVPRKRKKEASGTGGVFPRPSQLSS
jgi:hypothetical protein